MVTQILFSVIIPTRNEYLRLQYCLPSLLLQTLPDFEVIIIDDPETSDNTEKYVTSFQDFRTQYVVHPLGMRVSAKRNFGASKAQGKYLYFIDADMEFPLNTLEILIQEIEETQAQIVFVKERTPGVQWVARMKDLEKQIIQYTLTLISARIYSKAVFQKLGGFKDITIAGEEELSDRAIHQGAKHIISKAYVNHFEISDSLPNHYIKKINYGMNLNSYFFARKIDKYNKIAQARAGTVRLIYLISQKTWENPFLGIQFILFKLFEFFCLFLGWAIAQLNSVVKKLILI